MRRAPLRGPIAALLVLCAAACIRTTGKIPKPGEGLFIVGTVVERDLTTAEIAPVAGASVRVIGTPIAAKSDSRGFFQLERLPLGRHRVAIDRPARDMRPALARLLDPVNGLVQGQTIDLGQIELLGTGTLAGLVLLADDASGSASPVAAGGGALVVAAQTAFKAIAGEDGRFRLAGLPDGRIDLIAFHAGYAAARKLGLMVTAGTVYEVEDLVLVRSSMTPMVEVRGSAKLAGRDDSSGIEVRFIDETDPMKGGMTMTQASGAFALTIAAGVYRARFSRTDYCSVAIPGVAVLTEGVLGLVPAFLSPASGAGPDGCAMETPIVSTDAGVGGDGGPGTYLPPVIESFEPTEGHEGTLVTIHGRNFVPRSAGFNAVRFGATSFPVTPTRVSESTMMVVVPRDAATGPILVHSGDGEATSSQTFTFLPPPDIVDFAPKVTRPRAAVSVWGRHFTASDLRLFVNGRPADLVNGADGRPLLDQVLGPGNERLDRVRFRVPSDASSGSIRVETVDGGSNSASSLMVQRSTPSISSITPNPVAIGGTILIRGTGFSTDDTGGVVTVRFTGSDVLYSPVSVTDATVTIPVPPGVGNGFVTVVHPAGEASSAPTQLVVDLLAPALSIFSPTLAMEGAAITISGNNLQTATAVRFGGVLSPAPQITRSTIVAMVPAGAAPGPITVDFPAPYGPETTSRRLRILQRFENTQAQLNGVVGGGFCEDGTRLCFISMDGTRDRYDARTLAPIPGENAPLAFLQPQEVPQSFQVAPNGTAGVLTTLRGDVVQTHVVALPSFTQRGSCSPPDGRYGGAFPTQRIYVFDEALRLALSTRPRSYGDMRDGIFRVELDTGACSVTPQNGFPISGAGIQAVVSGSTPGELVLGHGTLGLATMNVVPGSPLDGRLILAWTPPPIDAYALFWGPGERHLFGRALRGSNPMLRYEPFSTHAPHAFAVMSTFANQRDIGVQSANRRWLLIYDSFTDLEWEESFPPVPDTYGLYFAAANPTESAFVASTNASRPVRYQIRE